jgi:trk system potassium uptake protein
MQGQGAPLAGLRRKSMKKQVVVIGLGRLGESIARTLVTIGHEVLALDRNENLVQAVAPFVTHAVQVDPTSEPALRELGVGNFDIGVVALSQIEDSVLSTILLQKLGVRFIIARASSEPHGTILEKLGADKVVYPEREMGTGMAYVLTLGNVVDYIPVTAAYGVVKMSVPSNFIGQSLSDIGFGYSGRLEVIVLLLQREQDIIVSPRTSETVRAEDALVVSGRWDKLEELFSQIQKPGSKKTGTRSPD